MSPHSLENIAGLSYIEDVIAITDFYRKEVDTRN